MLSFGQKRKMLQIWLKEIWWRSGKGRGARVVGSSSAWPAKVEVISVGMSCMNKKLEMEGSTNCV